MIKHESKILLGGLKGGLKPFPNCTKSFWIRPFFDPPGLLKVFQALSSAWPHGVSAHSDFFAKSLICSQDFNFYDRNASSVGENQIWLKTESTIFGHFFLRKLTYFHPISGTLKVSGHSKLQFLKIYMMHNSNYTYSLFWIGKPPKRDV